MSNHKKGFTIIEILMVVTLIGILSSVILGSLQSAKDKARIAIAESQIDQFVKSITFLANDTGEWPGHATLGVVGTGSSADEVWDLGVASAGLTSTDSLFPNWDGPYVATSTVDPWGNPYFFDTDYDVGTSSNVWVVVIGSFGPNGTGQNVFDSDNIYKIIHRE